MSVRSVESALPPGILEMGSGEPIVLLHGIMGSPSMWRRVMPRLAARHRVIALPAMGHHGGHPCSVRPINIHHIVDDAERSLDALGIDRAHLAGNSMGGWISLELSRRGRARSVCALSPAGMWDANGLRSRRSALKLVQQLTRGTYWLLPLTSRITSIRKMSLRDNAVYGDRTSPAEFRALAEAVLNCTAADDLLDALDQFEELTVTCPTDIAWSARDRIFPVEPFASTARARVIGARHILLDDVGHVPMLDDADLVANTILATVERASEPVQLACTS